MTAQKAAALLESPDFQREKDFQRMVDRIMPTDKTDAVLQPRGWNGALTFAEEGDITKGLDHSLQEKLLTGVAGVRQLLVSHLDWSIYNASGGPTEDARVDSHPLQRSTHPYCKDPQPKACG